MTDKQKADITVFVCAEQKKIIMKLRTNYKKKTKKYIKIY